MKKIKYMKMINPMRIVYETSELSFVPLYKFFCQERNFVFDVSYTIQSRFLISYFPCRTVFSPTLHLRGPKKPLLEAAEKSHPYTTNYSSYEVSNLPV
jgi:hypothetical protein